MSWVVCRREARLHDEHGRPTGWAILVLNELRFWQPATYTYGTDVMFLDTLEDAVAVALVEGGYPQEVDHERELPRRRL